MSETGIHFGRFDRGLSRFHRRVAGLNLRPRRLDPGFRGFDLGCRCGVVLHGVVKFLLRDCLLFCERRVALYVHLRSSLIRRRLRELGLRL